MESGDNMIVKSLSVPIGLEELMEGLTKEVLLKRPTDVYAFASEYFNKLLRMREKGCYKGHTPKQVRTVTKKTTQKRPNSTTTKLLLTGSNVATKSKIIEKRISRRSLLEETSNKKQTRKVVETKNKMTQKPSVDENRKTIEISPRSAQKNYKNLQKQGSGENVSLGATKKGETPRKLNENKGKEKEKISDNAEEKTNAKERNAQKENKKQKEQEAKGKQKNDDFTLNELQNKKVTNLRKPKESDHAKPSEQKSTVDNIISDKTKIKTQETEKQTESENALGNIKLKTEESKKDVKIKDYDKTIVDSTQAIKKNEIKGKEEIKGKRCENYQESKLQNHLIDSAKITESNNVNEEIMDKRNKKHQEQAISYEIQKHNKEIFIDLEGKGKRKDEEQTTSNELQKLNEGSNMDLEKVTQDNKIEAKKEGKDKLFEKQQDGIMELNDKAVIDSAKATQDNKIEGRKEEKDKKFKEHQEQAVSNNLQKHNEETVTDLTKSIQEGTIEGKKEDKLQKFDEETCMDPEKATADNKIEERRKGSDKQFEKHQEKSITSELQKSNEEAVVDSTKVTPVNKIEEKPKEKDKESEKEHTLNEIQKHNDLAFIDSPKSTQNNKIEEKGKKEKNKIQISNKKDFAGPVNEAENNNIEENKKRMNKKLEKYEEQTIPKELQEHSVEIITESIKQSQDNKLEGKNEEKDKEFEKHQEQATSNKLQKHNEETDLARSIQDNTIEGKKEDELKKLDEETYVDSEKATQGNKMEEKSDKNDKEFKTYQEQVTSNKIQKHNEETVIDLAKSNQDNTIAIKKEDEHQNFNEETNMDSEKVTQDNKIEEKMEEKDKVLEKHQDGTISKTKHEKLNEKAVIDLAKATQDNQKEERKKEKDKDSKKHQEQTISNELQRNEETVKDPAEVTQNKESEKHQEQAISSEHQKVNEETVKDLTKVTRDHKMEGKKKENYEEFKKHQEQATSNKLLKPNEDLAKATQDDKMEEKKEEKDKKLEKHQKQTTSNEEIEKHNEETFINLTKVTENNKIEEKKERKDKESEKHQDGSNLKKAPQTVTNSENSKNQIESPKNTKNTAQEKIEKKVKEDKSLEFIEPSKVKEIKPLLKENNLENSLDVDKIHSDKEKAKHDSKSNEEIEKKKIDVNTESSIESKPLTTLQSFKDIEALTVSDVNVNKEHQKSNTTTDETVKEINKTQTDKKSVNDKNHKEIKNNDLTSEKHNESTITSNLNQSKGSPTDALIKCELQNENDKAAKNKDAMTERKQLEDFIKAERSEIIPETIRKVELNASNAETTNDSTKTIGELPEEYEKSTKANSIERKKRSIEEDKKPIDTLNIDSSKDNTMKTIEKYSTELETSKKLSTKNLENNNKSTSEKVPISKLDPLDRSKSFDTHLASSAVAAAATPPSTPINREKNIEGELNNSEKLKLNLAKDSKEKIINIDKESANVLKEEIFDKVATENKEESTETLKQEKTKVKINDKTSKEVHKSERIFLKNIEEAVELKKDDKHSKTVTTNELLENNTEQTTENKELIQTEKLNQNLDVATVIKIQSLFRGFLARKHLQTKNKTVTQSQDLDLTFQRQVAAVIVIQKFWKKHHATNKKINFEKQVRAAIVVQKFWKRILTRKHKAATKIQANYRGYLIRKENKATNEQTSFEKRVRAAIVVQKFWKKVLARKHQAATKIQANYKGYLIRKDNKKSDIETALEALDTIKVPQESPKLKRELLVRSVTVEEPIIEKKHVALLGKTQSSGGFLFGPCSAPISDFKIKESNSSVLDKKEENKKSMQDKERTDITKTEQALAVVLQSQEKLNKTSDDNVNEEFKKGKQNDHSKTEKVKDSKEINDSKQIEIGDERINSEETVKTQAATLQMTTVEKEKDKQDLIKTEEEEEEKINGEATEKAAKKGKEASTVNPGKDEIENEKNNNNLITEKKLEIETQKDNKEKKKQDLIKTEEIEEKSSKKEAEEKAEKESKQALRENLEKDEIEDKTNNSNLLIEDKSKIKTQKDNREKDKEVEEKEQKAKKEEVKVKNGKEKRQASTESPGKDEIENKTNNNNLIRDNKLEIKTEKDNKEKDRQDLIKPEEKEQKIKKEEAKEKGIKESKQVLLENLERDEIENNSNDSNLVTKEKSKIKTQKDNREKDKEDLMKAEEKEEKTKKEDVKEKGVNANKQASTESPGKDEIDHKNDNNNLTTEDNSKIKTGKDNKEKGKEDLIKVEEKEEETKKEEPEKKATKESKQAFTENFGKDDTKNNNNNNKLVTENISLIKKQKDKNIKKLRLQKSKTQEKVNKLGTMKTSSFDISKLHSEIEEAFKDLIKTKKTFATLDEATRSVTKKFIETEKSLQPFKPLTININDSNNNVFSDSSTKKLQKSTDEDMLEKETPPNSLSLDETHEGDEEMTHEEILKIKRPVSMDSSTSVDSVITVIQRIDDEGKKEDLAATKIQATYRGHRVRRELEQMSNKDDEMVPTKSESNKESETFGKQIKEELKLATEVMVKDLAATKIQSTYRGHKVRKDLKNESLKDIEETPELKIQELKNQNSIQLSGAIEEKTVAIPEIDESITKTEELTSTMKQASRNVLETNPLDALSEPKLDKQESKMVLVSKETSIANEKTKLDSPSESGIEEIKNRSSKSTTKEQDNERKSLENLLVNTTQEEESETLKNSSENIDTTSASRFSIESPKTLSKTKFSIEQVTTIIPSKTSSDTLDNDGKEEKSFEILKVDIKPKSLDTNNVQNATKEQKLESDSSKDCKIDTKTVSSNISLIIKDDNDAKMNEEAKLYSKTTGSSTPIKTVALTQETQKEKVLNQSLQGDADKKHTESNEVFENLEQDVENKIKMEDSKSKNENSKDALKPDEVSFKEEKYKNSSMETDMVMPAIVTKLETNDKFSENLLKSSITVNEKLNPSDEKTTSDSLIVMKETGVKLTEKVKTSNDLPADDTKLKIASKNNSSISLTQPSAEEIQNNGKINEKGKFSEKHSSAEVLQSATIDIKSEAMNKSSDNLVQPSTKLHESGTKNSIIDQKTNDTKIVQKEKEETPEKLLQTPVLTDIEMDVNDKLSENLTHLSTLVPQNDSTTERMTEASNASSEKLIQSPNEIAKESHLSDNNLSSTKKFSANFAQSSITTADSKVNEKVTSSEILPEINTETKNKSFKQSSVLELSDSSLDTNSSKFENLTLSSTDNIKLKTKNVPSHNLPQSLLQTDDQSKEALVVLEDNSKTNVEENPQTSPSPTLVYTGELQEGAIPLTVPLDQSSGTKELTSSTERRRRRRLASTTHARLKTIDGDAAGDKQQSTANNSSVEMDQNKRVNSSIVKNKSVEAEAATKIQASFRGYQVRKQLKQNKNESPDITNNQRRQNKRKSSGSLSETFHDPETRKEIEERSATKIQAGIRGFLVRKRQKNAKKSPAEAS